MYALPAITSLAKVCGAARGPVRDDGAPRVVLDFTSPRNRWQDSELSAAGVGVAVIGTAFEDYECVVAWQCSVALRRCRDLQHTHQPVTFVPECCAP